MSLTIRIIFILFCTIALNAKEAGPIDWGADPWPEIRKERIQTLLPEAMRAADVDAWITICRENNNDPLADHIGGENASGSAVFLFYRTRDGFHSKVFSPIGESTALDELDIHDEVIPIAWARNADKWLTKNHLKHDFREYLGMGHGINQECFKDMLNWIAERYPTL